MVSQLGWQIGAPAEAAVHLRGRRSAEWTLERSDGSVVARGRTVRMGVDAASALPVHKISVPALSEAEEGLTLHVCDQRSGPISIESNPFENLANDSARYFYLNRAGVDLPADYAGAWARPAGHKDEVATCFHGQDQWGTEWPACSHRLDVSGGWYDAGDFGKYVVNGGIAVWTLQHAVERAERLGLATQDGALNIPESGNGVDDLLDEARIGLEFLMAMQVPDGAEVAVARGVQEPGEPLEVSLVDAGGLAHHKVHAHNWDGFPMLPEDSVAERFLYAPSTAAALNLAAAAAQGARLWQDKDPAFAARALHAAQRAFAAAQRIPDAYAYNNFDGGGPYGDTALADEFAWAAIELFLTTGDRSYLTSLDSDLAKDWVARLHAQAFGDIFWSGMDLLPSLSVSLNTDLFSEDERERFAAALIVRADAYAALTEKSGYGSPLPHNGYGWGSSGDVAYRGLVLASAHDLTADERYRDAAVRTMEHLVGRHPTGVSMVSGYGDNAMRYPHHRFWGAGADPAYPEAPPGAVSGGPNNSNPADAVARRLNEAGCAALFCWADDADSYATNEVAINWNAPVAALSRHLATTPPTQRTE